MKTLKDQIKQLKNEKNIAILAHYYVPEEVQEVADYVGDSYYLSKIGREIPEKTLCFCGVSFMGESGKTLNPEKTVIMPSLEADCPMAHMYNLDKIKELKTQVEDLAVVCYVNSEGRLKSVSDVCVTSANAEKVVNALPNKNIYFVPDKNLGGYLQEKLKEKTFILNGGFCPVHNAITEEDVKKQKMKHPHAELLVHPECTADVVKNADYIGSTSGIISYVEKSSKKEFIIGTELGVISKLKQIDGGKTFYPLREDFICQGMKLNTLENLCQCLKHPEAHVVEVRTDIAKGSLFALEKMLELSK